jgi:hypothetical protein
MERRRMPPFSLMSFEQSMAEQIKILDNRRAPSITFGKKFRPVDLEIDSLVRATA